MAGYLRLRGLVENKEREVAKATSLEALAFEEAAEGSEKTQGGEVASKQFTRLGELASPPP